MPKQKAPKGSSASTEINDPRFSVRTSPGGGQFHKASVKCVERIRWPQYLEFYYRSSIPPAVEEDLPDEDR